MKRILVLFFLFLFLTCEKEDVLKNQESIQALSLQLSKLSETLDAFISLQQQTNSSNSSSFSQLRLDLSSIKESLNSLTETEQSNSYDLGVLENLIKGLEQRLDQLDIDKDGVLNQFDKCSDTPLGSSVDSNGCASTQAILKPENIISNLTDKTIEPWEILNLEVNLLTVNNNLINITKESSLEIKNLKIASLDDFKIRGKYIGATELIINYKGIEKRIPLNVDIQNNFKVFEPKLIGIGSESSIQVNPVNPENIIASTNFYNYYSLDGGENWLSTNSQLPTYADPNIKFNSEGDSFRQGLIGGDPRGIGLQKSKDGGRNWESLVTSYKPEKNGGNPDQGFMVIDTLSNSLYKNSIYIIASDYPSPPYTTTNYSLNGFGLLMLISRDGGQTWLDPIDISSDSIFGQEHSSYVTIGPNGEIYAAWKTNGRGIRFSKSLDGGITWSPEKVIEEKEPENTSDDVRGNITIKVDLSSKNKGDIYISSMDNGNKDQPFSDSYIVSSRDGGNTWSSKTYFTDGPKNKFNYYFQPRIDIAPNGRIDAIWYDTRNWGGNNNNEVSYDVYYTFSDDGGETFSPNIKLNNSSYVKYTNCENNKWCGERKLYEYIGLHSENERVVASWTALKDRDVTIFSSIWHKN